MSPRLRHALATGLRAAAIAAFANAAVAVVLAAGLHDVNHVHEPGTPQHVHALGEVFGPLSVATAAVTVAAQRETRPAPSLLEVAAPHAPRVWSAYGVRDPPRLPS